MDVISLYIFCILASSQYALFNLYNNSWFSSNMPIKHLWNLLSAHFKQLCSENTGAYKPVRFPAPFVITTLDCHVLFSLIMFISVDIYTVFVLFPCVMLYRILCCDIACYKEDPLYPIGKLPIPQITILISHNAPVPYPTMHNFVAATLTCVHISVTKSRIVGYLSDALWDLWDGSIILRDIAHLKVLFVVF